MSANWAKIVAYALAGAVCVGLVGVGLMVGAWHIIILLCLLVVVTAKLLGRAELWEGMWSNDKVKQGPLNLGVEYAKVIGTLAVMAVMTVLVMLGFFMLSADAPGFGGWGYLGGAFASWVVFGLIAFGLGVFLWWKRKTYLRDIDERHLAVVKAANPKTLLEELDELIYAIEETGFQDGFLSMVFYTENNSVKKKLVAYKSIRERAEKMLADVKSDKNANINMMALQSELEGIQKGLGGRGLGDLIFYYQFFYHQILYKMITSLIVGSLLVALAVWFLAS